MKVKVPQQLTALLIVVLQLVGLSMQSATDSKDLLNGYGSFSSSSQLAYWRVINATAYKLGISNSGQAGAYLTINKTDEALGAYDDGIFYYFGDSKPQHITVQLQTSNPDIETCDVRLTSVNQNVTFFYNKIAWLKIMLSKFIYNWQDVAFFRFGYFNYMKMNLVSMVQKFTNATWYQVDLLVDWDNQAVTVYVNNTLLASQLNIIDIFFTNTQTTVNSANAIVLYNLSPASSCQVKNLKVCNVRCSGGESLIYAFASTLGKVTATLGLFAVSIFMNYL